MKDKIINYIRNFIINKIVPISKKKEEIKRKIRLSLKFRIAYTYGKLMVINSLVTVLVFFLAFLIICEMSFENKIDTIINNVQSNSNVLDKEELEENIYVFYSGNNEYELIDDKSEIDNYKNYIYHNRVNPYFFEDLTMRIYDDNNEIIYDDVEHYYVDHCNIFEIAYLKGKGDNVKLYIIEKRDLLIDGKMCTAFFQMNFSNEMIVFQRLTWFMLAITILMAFIFASSGVKRTQFIFEPINQMASITNRMTVNSLSSERLNIEGTKNELKDLAAIINSMLDRLDISYESQKQFVSDASHELRTPIAVIQGYINMLDRWGKSDESVMEESIEAIKNEAQTMKELVEKLLFLSRHDKKTLKLDKKVFDVKKVIEEMIKETKLVVANRNINFEYLENTLIVGDKQAIKQALRILIDNAIKYSDDGADIFISCKHDENGGSIIEVRDTGFGMTKYDLENIFERFYRSDNVRDKKIVGNGLGLSLAKLIVLKHTGTITVTSQLNKGTSFKLNFPPLNIN